MRPPVACKSTGWLEITPKWCQTTPHLHWRKYRSRDMGSNSRLKAHRKHERVLIFRSPWRPPDLELTFFFFSKDPCYKPSRLSWQQNDCWWDEKTTLSLCGARWTLSWTICQSMNTINVPMNTRHWFSCWCFNWIELKRERGWPFRWPLSMEPCLEHNLMNDPGVRGWSGQPCLTPGHISPCAHLASLEIMCQKTASIWQAFFFSMRLNWKKN